MPDVKEQHIAVFGEAGSGKTVLVSSFFGPAQEPSFANGMWDLVANNAGQKTRLLQNYLGMRDDAQVPAGTHFAATTYSFSVKLKGATGAASQLRLSWHDYPGEWFSEDPSSEEEAERRVKTFRDLLCSDVAFVLVDGQMLLDHKGEEERYLKSLFMGFRQALLQLKDDLLVDGDKLVEFPRIWVLALSKADLLPDLDVQTFHDLVIRKAGQHVEMLRETLSELVVTPDAMSLGDDFMLLSSAKFELSPEGDAPVKIDVRQQVGLDLMLPVAFMLPLQRLALWMESMKLPTKLLGKLADGVGGIAQVLADGRTLGIDRLLARLPRVGPLASTVAVPALIAGAHAAEAHLKDLHARAVADKDNLTASLTQFRLDLDRGVSDGLLIRREK